MRENKPLDNRKYIVDKVLEQFPKFISPKAHALFDAFTFNKIPLN